MTGWATPRQPAPPFPEFSLHRWRFDEALQQYPWPSAPATVPDASLVESWSGYALRRVGTRVTPFVIAEWSSTTRPNFTPATGAIRFWFKPDWGSPSTGCTGPGSYARLLELVSVGANSAAMVQWSLYAAPDGSALYCSGPGANGPRDYLRADLQWLAASWHLVQIAYTPTNSALYLDGEVAALGDALPWPVAPTVAQLALVVGSELSGATPAQGDFDELTTFARPQNRWEIAHYYLANARGAALGPVSAEELLALTASREAALGKAKGGLRGGGVPMLRRIVGGTSECLTNVPVFLTNIVSAWLTNQGWTVTFDLQGGTNGLLYDVFTTTALARNCLADARWTWLERGPTCSTYEYTNQPAAGAYYVLGTPQDSDGDGLTDAFERLVTKTDPTTGVNRIQSENVITGTTNWMLANPAVRIQHSNWPTNDADAIPEIQGFASATSVNVGGTLDLYVDVRNGDPHFTFEIFRLGWYGGLGGRQMTWSADGQPVTRMTPSSRKQPLPGLNPTNGLIDCLLPAPANPGGPWTNSYTLTVPPDWVSGVYVAKLTTGTNVTPQTTGRQSYIVFVVRDDARPSDLLFQCSVTTYQAYNPWGGSSLYRDIPPGSPEGKAVSFNRPYGLGLGGSEWGAKGAGAGAFLALHNGAPAWEYNAVRWLERQGYDLTYTCDVETHRFCPTNKAINAFLSVGHDEYWSSQMRTNVESARDSGVNLAFFGANACYWRIHFKGGERVFSCEKNYASTNYDLWRGAVVNNPEVSMVGVELVYVDGKLDMKIAYPLATNPVTGGVHWAYNHSGLQGGESLTNLLGYEMDGWWEGEPCGVASKGALPGTGTVILAHTRIEGVCATTGHAYMTLYTNSSASQVFATGSMNWNWGLDDYWFPLAGPQATVRQEAQQMSHNVLQTFTGRPTAPIMFTNLDALTSGNWTGHYGAEGYCIANSALLTNLPNYAQVTLSNAQTLVWTNQASDPRALINPGPSSERIAAAWTTAETQNSSFTLDLNFAAGHTNYVALYCVDWGGSGGVIERIEVFDSSDTLFVNPLDTRDFLLPGNGIYFVWKLCGHNVIRVTKRDSDNRNKAVVSALFLGGGY